MTKYVILAFWMVLLGTVQARAQASPYGAMPPAQTGQPAQTPYMAAPVPAAPSVQAPVNLPPPTTMPNPAPLNLPQIPGYTAPGMPVQQGGTNASPGGVGK
jgi:hypothetical protein